MYGKLDLLLCGADELLCTICLAKFDNILGLAWLGSQ